jgi:hypothetical protein
MAAAERLSTITDEILTEVQQLPAELIHWVPAEGIWTVMDNLCHIREFVPFWTGEALRRAAETLRSLSDEDLAAEGMSKNPRWGLKPASFVVDDLLVHHVAKHQGQIRRNVSQFNEARAKR